MIKFLRHICAIFCAMLAIVMAVSCGSPSGVPQEPDDSAGMYLVFNVGMVGESRANSVLSNEAMHNLRIIILDEKGIVEINEYIPFEAVREKYYHISEVKPGPRKRVYLFSNEESVTNIQTEPSGISLSGNLHDYLEGVVAGVTDFESKIAAINYKPDFTKDIALNAMYDVEIPDGVRFVEKTFWLVRVATKFSFTFQNDRLYDAVKVNRFEVSGLAERHYLMPKFTGGIVPTFAGYPTWIDWLKDVSEKSQIDPYNPSSDQSGWLTGYDIPSSPNTSVLSHNTAFTLAKASATTPGGKYEIGNMYACESKNLRNDGNNVIAKEQQYKLSVTCTSNSVTKVFTVPLPNLRSLFRNTHVHVSVTFADGDFNINPVVDVIPFSEVILEPSFGLERDDVTGYVVVRDPVTGAIKWWLDSNGGRWWLYEDGESHYVFAYDDPQLNNLDHWFDYKGGRHELTPAGISKLTPHKNSIDQFNIDYYIDSSGYKYWLEEGKWFTIDKYNYSETGDNPSGPMLGWYDFTGEFHAPSEPKETALAAWLDILKKISSSEP